MLKSEEVIFIKKLFLALGSKEKAGLISDSNLTDIEKRVMIERFICGRLAKEVADGLNLSQDGFDRFQKKIYIKFYFWLTHHPEFTDYLLLVDDLDTFTVSTR